MADGTHVICGRLVLDDRVEPGSITVVDGRITSVDPDPSAADGPFVAPGFVDIHVHGWGGHDAMASIGDLDGMARGLLRRGVTSFLPTAVTAPISALHQFADQVRGWTAAAPADGAAPLGFNLEGPFLAAERRGAHDPAHLRAPADVAEADLAPLLEGLRVITVAPETRGAIALIERLHGSGVAISLGHSAASLQESRAGYRAGARTTTHLFNAMSGVDHRAPGLAVAALTDDAVFVELIADTHHVHPDLWPIILRTKPAGRLVLVSDATPIAGTDRTSGTIGGLEVVVRDGRCELVAGGALAGSLIALDDAVRNLVRSGVALSDAVAAATRNPLAVLGVVDRGRIAVGQCADLVELDEDLRVRRVARAGEWLTGAGA